MTEFSEIEGIERLPSYFAGQQYHNNALVIWTKNGRYLLSYDTIVCSVHYDNGKRYFVRY